MAMVELDRDKIKRVVVSVDWGYVNPGTMQVWAVDGDGRMYLVYEIYMTKRLIEWWTSQAAAIQRHFRPEVFVCDPAEPAFIKQLRNAGCNAIGAKNEVLPGIELVQQRLSRGHDDEPRLLVSSTALAERDGSLAEARKPTCLAQEMSGYVWKVTPDGKADKDEPEKLNDHACDALRYAVYYLDGKPPRREARSYSG